MLFTNASKCQPNLLNNDTNVSPFSQHLVSGLTPADVNTTVIVVMIGETDLEYVIKTARQIEAM